MAQTRFLTNDGLTRKKWARDLFKIILPAVEFSSLVGKGTNSVIQMRTELGKGEGDRITFGIRLPLTGEGIVGNDTVEGNEEKLVFKNFNMTIEELNHAVDTGGKMEQQRVPYDLMKEGRDGLQEWWSDKLSDLAFAVLCGDTDFTIAGSSFAQDQSNPDADHTLVVNDATAGSLTSADELDLHFLDRMKQRAIMPASSNSFKVRPLMIKGKKFFRVILHTYVFDKLRQNTNVAQWGDLKRSADKLQQVDTEIEYNGLLVTKSERVRNPDASNEYRNVLLGAQAACFAWGGAGESKSTTMSFVPYEKDAKRFVMIRGGGIFGMKKTRFNSRDYGIVTGKSYATALT